MRDTPNAIWIICVLHRSKIIHELHKEYVLQEKSTEHPHQYDKSISYLQSKTPKIFLDGPELAVWKRSALQPEEEGGHVRDQEAAGGSLQHPIPWSPPCISPTIFCKAERFFTCCEACKLNTLSWHQKYVQLRSRLRLVPAEFFPGWVKKSVDVASLVSGQLLRTVCKARCCHTQAQ